MKCERCKINKANIQFSMEPMNALIRGYGIQNICRKCYIKKIEKELESIKENLKKERTLLIKEIISDRKKIKFKRKTKQKVVEDRN